MKVVVLSGSPKGETSLTLQAIRFLQKKVPGPEITVFHIAPMIHTLEKNERRLGEIIDAVKAADGVIWAFPVYYFLVPSQYKRFIELIWERKHDEAFRGKYAITLSTSVHFHDHCAHDYMNAICDDLEMRYVGSFSADSHDLLKASERERLLLFGRNFFDAIDKQLPTMKTFQPLQANALQYVPGALGGCVATEGKRVVILTDSDDPSSNQGKMVHRVRSTFSPEAEVISLATVDITGGCLGCLECGYDGTCRYKGKDELVALINDRVLTADVLVFAGTIVDRFLSSRWKLYLDRCFFRNHMPYLGGKQVALLISGPLRQIPNLRQIFDAYAEYQEGNLVGTVTDEGEDSASLDALLSSLATKLVERSKQRYLKPRTFLGIGGLKVLRDEIFGRLRSIFWADHKYFAKHGMYDFPQKNYGIRIFNLIVLLALRIPYLRRAFQKRIGAILLQPVLKAVDKA